jgi:metal-responsive CopG/Arc/MetJ family transcriptional regulator
VKVETSVLLPEELLAEIDKADPDRSGLVERAVRMYLSLAPQPDQGLRDLEIMNANADYLNEEIADVLEYGAYLD